MSGSQNLSKPISPGQPTPSRWRQGRLGLEMRLLGYVCMVLAAVSLGWPEAWLFTISGVPGWLAAASLILGGVMLVRGGHGLHHAALESAEHRQLHLGHSRACFVLASVFFSPMLLCLLVHVITVALHG